MSGYVSLGKNRVCVNHSSFNPTVLFNVKNTTATQPYPIFHEMPGREFLNFATFLIPSTIFHF